MAPKLLKKPAASPKKAADLQSEAHGKKKRKARKESYSSYVYKVLKQVCPDTGILNYPLAACP
jgi:histone H2B